MLKLKKKLVPILSFIFVLVACCLAWLSFNSVEARAEDAPKQVVLSEFQFFNAYSEDSQNVTIGQGKFGMLLRFDDVLSDNRSEVNGGIKTVNLLDKYGKNIFINDMPLDFYKYAEVCYYYEEYMWVYIPNMDSYRKLSVETAFQFEDRIIQPFALYTAISDQYGFTYTYWTDKAEDYLNSKTNEVKFKGIEFNNTGYRYFSPQKGLLLEFDQCDENGNWLNKDLSNTLSEKDGSWMEINLINEPILQNKILGEGASVGENILLDGIPFKDIPGAEINYHSQRFLWLYVPNMIDYEKLVINDHTLFLDSYLPGLELYSNGNEWVEFDPNAPREEMEKVSYEGIEWNNCDFGYRGGKNGLLMEFSKNLSNLGKEIDGSVRGVNKITSAIGEHVRLNGEALKNIAGTEISYHSEEYLWVYIPSENLKVTDGNFPCLTIDADTEFLNAILPAVTLYFDGSCWQETAPNVADYANNAYVDMKYNNATVEGNTAYTSTVLTFEDDFSTEMVGRPNFAQTGDVGHKIKINGKSFNELYKADSNTHCLFGDEAYGDNTLSLLVRKSDLYPTAEYPITTLTIEEGTLFMDKTLSAKTFYLVDGKWSETSAPSSPLEEDTDAPYIYYYGEEEYLVFTGEEVIDFSSMVFAFDEFDGNLACMIEIPDSAVTDGKWNRGKWDIKMFATDAQGNISEKTIKVTVINTEEQYLSIYVNGFFSLRVKYGEKISVDKSEELLRGEPIKADTATSYFVFLGWTFNGRLWDFENDIVTEDVKLSPMFKEYKRLYTVTLKDVVSGETNFVTVKAGDTIDIANYQKEGYSLIAKVEGMLINSITVNSNIMVELQYTATAQQTPVVDAEEPTNDNNLFILIGCWGGAAFLIVVCVILYGKSNKPKKKGKEETVEQPEESVTVLTKCISNQELAISSGVWNGARFSITANITKEEKLDEKAGEQQ